MKIQYLTSAQMGACPAEVDIATGTVSVNRSVWDGYTDIQQRFMLLHEEGHYRLQTDSEEKADEYAIRRMYGTFPQSLKTVVRQIGSIPFISPARLESLYRAALRIDAKENRNEKAINELNILKMNVITKQRKQPFNGSRRIDGGTGEGIENPGENNNGNGGDMLGGGNTPQNHIQKQQPVVFFNVRQHRAAMTNILLCAIIVILLVKLNK
ncbi:MAG: hypothetical protein IKK36_02705 [Bacteroidales bacterium]|nr:hypothetical protein [Bacteroidales bacterium]